ncbi:MAG: urea carboxylase-associated family protein [Solirubrobacteraceae bacterium]
MTELTIRAGEGWVGELAAGGRLRIVDLHGNQAVDTLLFNAHDYSDRYSAVDTIVAQRNVYLTSGSRLLTARGTVLARIVADTCGRHDTLGGACAPESNDVRYGRHTRFMHACRDTFTACAHRWGHGLDSRDFGPNINFFMNVPIDTAGGLTFADGISGPGKYVELQAESDTLILISNCPQLNNPCNGYDPTPIQLVLWPPV